LPAILKFLGLALVALLIALGLAVTIVPRFLDRIYYRGPESDHFDGERFFNPDGEDTTVPTTQGGGRAGFFWRQLTGSDGRPEWPARVAVTPSKPEPRVEGTRMVATWIGHATVLVQTNGLNILTDPIWSDRASPVGFTGPKRVAEPGVRFEDLPKIDLVLVSHNHYDHMDLSTLKRLWERDKPLIVTSLGNDAVLRGAGIPPRNAYHGLSGIDALDWNDVAWLGGDSLDEGATARRQTYVVINRNHHWGSRWFADRNRALWSSFAVKLPGGGNLFFAGDTGMGDGRWPIEAAQYGPVRLALIPVGAFRFAPGQMASGSHIGPVDAVEVHRRLASSTSIPIHWGTFRLSFEGYDTPPRLLAAAMRETGQRGFAPVGIGQPVEIPPYAPPAAAAEVPRAELLKRLDTPEVRALR
jgi:L-ascorbate metabolism protein UlaG (beta-lactamase superfamily)